MHEKAVILVSRVRNNKKELLFIRLHGKNFWQFPVAVKDGNQPIKLAIRKALQDTLKLDTSSISKETVISYQAPQSNFVMMIIYSAEANNNPQLTEYVENFVWLNESEVEKRTSQMSNVMQDTVLPCLQENKLWV